MKLTVTKKPYFLSKSELLSHHGIFRLHHVCKILSQKEYEIRLSALDAPSEWLIRGVWRDPESDQWLVDMSLFSRWYQASVSSLEQEVQRRVGV